MRDKWRDFWYWIIYEDRYDDDWLLRAIAKGFLSVCISVLVSIITTLLVLKLLRL